MESSEPGTDTSGAELTNVSQHGLWLLIDDQERYLPYDQFPWFRHATIARRARSLGRGTP